MDVSGATMEESLNTYKAINRQLTIEMSYLKADLQDNKKEVVKLHRELQAAQEQLARVKKSVHQVLAELQPLETMTPERNFRIRMNIEPLRLTAVDEANEELQNTATSPEFDSENIVIPETPDSPPVRRLNYWNRQTDDFAMTSTSWSEVKIKEEPARSPTVSRHSPEPEFNLSTVVLSTPYNPRRSFNYQALHTNELANQVMSSTSWNEVDVEEELARSPIVSRTSRLLSNPIIVLQSMTNIQNNVRINDFVVMKEEPPEVKCDSVAMERPKRNKPPPGSFKESSIRTKKRRIM